MWEIRAAVKSLQTLMQSPLHVLLLLLCTLFADVFGGEMCTKSVPVQRVPNKKVHVLRRVPASCSNWEKAWAWITKKDCGTKYRLDLVDVPSEKVVTYRMVKVCCEGDVECIQAQEELAAKGLEVSDEKFLAIILGSTAAAVFVLVLVISISLCRRKKQCTFLCEDRRHIYTTAEDVEESSELQDQKVQGLQGEETDHKVCESEYAEITDSSLPRYTDIFRESEDPDPFTHATAPPIPSYESRAETVVKNDDLARESRDITVTDISNRDTSPQQQQPPPPPPPQLPSKDYTRYCNWQPAEGQCVVQEEAVLNLTQDDPAVLTSWSPSCPMLTAPRPRTSVEGESLRTSVDGESLIANAKPPSTTAVYETLGVEEGGHEYQCLSSSSSSSPLDSQVSSVDQCARTQLQACVHREAGAVLSGGCQSPAEC